MLYMYAHACVGALALCMVHRPQTTARHTFKGNQEGNFNQHTTPAFKVRGEQYHTQPKPYI